MTLRWYYLAYTAQLPGETDQINYGVSLVFAHSSAEAIGSTYTAVKEQLGQSATVQVGVATEFTVGDIRQAAQLYGIV
jgi:hypothetical protein